MRGTPTTLRACTARPVFSSPSIDCAPRQPARITIVSLPVRSGTGNIGAWPACCSTRGALATDVLRQAWQEHPAIHPSIQQRLRGSQHASTMMVADGAHRLQHRRRDPASKEACRCINKLFTFLGPMCCGQLLSGQTRQQKATFVPGLCDAFPV